jgi:hypothetical protein
MIKKRGFEDSFCVSEATSLKNETEDSFCSLGSLKNETEVFEDSFCVSAATSLKNETEVLRIVFHLCKPH